MYLHSSTDLADVRDEELMTPPVSRESPTPAFFDPVSWFPNHKVAKYGAASQEKCEMVRLRTPDLGQQWHGSKLNDSSCPIQNKMVS